MQIRRVGRIQAIFRSQAPIAVAQGHSNAGDRVGAQKFFGHVFMQRRRLSVADKNPDQSFALIRPDRFLLLLYRQSANRVRRLMLRRSSRWQHRKSSHDSGK